MSKKKYKKTPKPISYGKDEYWPRGKGWTTPDMLEVMRDQMCYAQVVKEEYERAKEAFGLRKALSPDRLQPADLEGG
jgi:hypothetical protein